MNQRWKLTAAVLLGAAFALAGAAPAQEEIPLRGWDAPPYWRASAASLAESEKAGPESPPVSTLVSPALSFVGLTPCRVADTRDASFPPGYGPPAMPGGSVRSFVLPGRCGVAAEAQAVSFNFTVTNTLGGGFLLVYPAGGAVPSVSTLNYLGGQTVANAGVVPLGAGGAISAIPGVSGFDLIVDVNGYYAPQTVVSSVNGLSGAVSLAEGTGIAITPAGNTLTLASTATGTITGVTAGTGLAGGGTSGTVTLNLAVPLGLTAASADPILTTTNTGTGGGLWTTVANGNAVKGVCTGPECTGVVGSHESASGNWAAVHGFTNSAEQYGTGVAGWAMATSPTGDTLALVGHNYSTNSKGFAIHGWHDGDGIGLRAGAAGPGGTGIQGVHNATTGTAAGVHGWTNSGDASATGIFGHATATAPAGNTFAISGYNAATNQMGYGVNGWHAGSGTGVQGGADGASGVGVHGYAQTAVLGNAKPAGTGVKGSSDGAGGKGVWGVGTTTASAGVFDGPVVVNGDLTVNGTVFKSGGSFRIDHPLDPENRWLVHSFVESPDMKNVYDGVVTTDEKGFATVALPDWFEALNGDFRYQLTVHGDGEAWARARIFRKIAGNRFVIQTDQPGVEVSWQVTGTRRDAWAERNRLPVEETKDESSRGRYLHPDAFGQPESKRIGSGGRLADR